jgi:hypothetical protein
VQLPFRAERIDDAVGDDRRGARPFVEAEVVAVGRRIRVAPDAVARPRIDRLDDLFATDAMKQDDARPDDDGAGEAGADLLAPDDLRT